MTTVLNQTVEFLATSSAPKPAPQTVVDALLEAEKNAKKTKIQYPYAQFLGTWRLGFITGTKKSRQQAGVILGAGRFMPRWIKICIAYDETEEDRGTVQNIVNFGSMAMIISGPVKFWSKKNILGFDFTRMKISFLGIKIYEGYIRQGEEREANFYQQTLKEQAFFSYFFANENCIAARGRGGGLALWTRVDEQ